MYNKFYLLNDTFILFYPLSDKYPSLSPYAYCAFITKVKLQQYITNVSLNNNNCCNFYFGLFRLVSCLAQLPEDKFEPIQISNRKNPVILVDPDGREIEGFSVDNKGNVQIDKDIASQHAIRAYEAMSMTETGTQSFVDMINMETQISFEITEQAIYSDGKQVYGKTEGDVYNLTEKGEYKTAKITITTADGISDPNGRYNGFSDNEKINGIGTHERMHIYSRQINIDHGYLPIRHKEQRPVMLEYKTRNEFRQKYGNEGDQNLNRNYQNFLYKRNWEKVN
jgi:hypothetical protein